MVKKPSVNKRQPVKRKKSTERTAAGSVKRFNRWEFAKTFIPWTFLCVFVYVSSGVIGGLMRVKGGPKVFLFIMVGLCFVFWVAAITRFVKWTHYRLKDVFLAGICLMSGRGTSCWST